MARGTDHGVDAQDHLPTDAAGIQIPVPPIEEQRAIIEHVDRATAEIDAIIDRVAVASARLRDYRSTLLGSFVTGKIVLAAGTADIATESANLPESPTHLAAL